MSLSTPNCRNRHWNHAKKLANIISETSSSLNIVTHRASRGLYRWNQSPSRLETLDKRFALNCEVITTHNWLVDLLHCHQHLIYSVTAFSIIPNFNSLLLIASTSCQPITADQSACSAVTKWRSNLDRLLVQSKAINNTITMSQEQIDYQCLLNVSLLRTVSLR